MEYFELQLPAIIGLISAFGALSSALVELVKPIIKRRFNKCLLRTWPQEVKNELNILSSGKSHFELPPKDFLKLHDDLSELFLSNPKKYATALKQLTNTTYHSILGKDILTVSNYDPTKPVSHVEVNAIQRVRKNLQIRNNLKMTLVLQEWKKRLLVFAGIINMSLVLIFTLAGYIPLRSVPIILVLGTVLAPVSRDIYKIINRLRALR